MNFGDSKQYILPKFRFGGSVSQQTFALLLIQSPELTSHPNIILEVF
jgi:hypothetical protein